MNTVVYYRADGGTHFLEFDPPISTSQADSLPEFPDTEVEPSRLTLRSDRDSIVALKWPPEVAASSDVELYGKAVAESIGRFSVPKCIIFD